MEKEISIKIPQSWEDITLKKYLALQKELKNYEDNEEAQTAIMIQYLTGLDAKHLSGLSIEDYDMIKDTLNKFIENTVLPLQIVIQIDGIEYGFVPNLSEIEYGAYLDITQYDTISIDDNWAKIMDILYRPITNKLGKKYEVRPYTGKIDAEKWYNVGMNVHFGALNFFFYLLMDLLNDTLNSLKKEEWDPNIKSILEKSGKVTKRLLKLPEEI